MDSETIPIIVAALLLAGVLVGVYWAHRRRQLHFKRQLLMELFKAYFNGDVPADQLGRRAQQIVSGHFVQSPEFYSLAVAAFQGAMDARLARRPHGENDEKKLFGLMAALKNKFGLPDLYRIEAWRPGRE
jgi:hypothetical protein